MKKYFYLITLLLLLTSCQRKQVVLDPYEFAPKNISSMWIPMNKNKQISSTCITPLIPKSYEKQKLSLAELIDIGLINNPFTKQSWAKARSAAASYAQSKSSYFPSINADASYTRERQTHLDTSHRTHNSKKFTHFYQTEVNPEITLSYIVYDFGKRKSSSDAAKYALFYADWMHNDNIQSIMKTIISSYYSYQYEKKAYKAKIKDLETSKETLEAAKEKLKVGVSSKADVSQAKTKYLQTKIYLISKKNDLKRSYAELINNIGIPSNEKILIEDLPKNAFIDIVIGNLDFLIEKAEKFRQDFLAQKANVSYYKQKLIYAKSNPMPNIEADFEIGRNYYDKAIHEDYHFAAAIKFSIPLFKGFYYRNAIKKAKADLLKAKADLQQKELSVIKEVVETRTDVICAKETLEASNQYLQAAKVDFDIAITNYKAGTNSILDLLSAQSALFDARAKKAHSKTSWFSSIANLAYSTGALIHKEDNNE